MLYLSQWWFIATAWHSLVLLAYRPVAAALSIWLAYLAFSIVRTVGLRLVRPTREQPSACSCCVFSARSAAVRHCFGCSVHIGDTSVRST